MTNQQPSFFQELRQRNVIRVGSAYAVAAWLLVQVADIGLESFEAPTWVMRALIIALALGFLLAVLLAWVYELTPEGIKRESEIDRSRAPLGTRGRRLDFVIIALLSVALLYFVTQHDWGGRDSAGDRAKSIAVLPFDNLSDSQENAFFASGVHEDVLTYLSKVADLRVIARSSVRQFADGARDPGEIAAALEVDHIVEGSVRRAGNRVRVTAQLIDARTEAHLWAENYDRDLSDVFGIQTAIAQEIVAALEARLSPDERQAIASVPTRNIEAYDKYSEARAIRRDEVYSVQSVAEMEPLLLEAVALDPDFAVAWALLGSIHTNFYWLNLDRTRERLDRARAAIDRAFELAPTLPEARAALAEYYYRGFNNYPRALAELEAAYEQFPNNAEILELMGILQRRLGRWPESIDSLRAATQLDPGNLGKKQLLLETLTVAHEWGQARDLADELSLRHAAEPWLRELRADVYFNGYGDPARAWEALGDTSEIVLNPDYLYLKLSLMLMREEFDAAKAMITEHGPFFENFPQGPGGQAYVYAWIEDIRGDTGAMKAHARDTLRLLEPALDADDPNQSSWWLLIGEAYAMLDRPDRGREIAREVLALNPLSRDAMETPNHHSRAARLLMMTGEVDEGLGILAAVVDQPAGPTRWELRLHPFWDFIREDPRFAALAGLGGGS
jgi:TolB-like protein/predicted Zn-dependent protease